MLDVWDVVLDDFLGFAFGFALLFAVLTDFALLAPRFFLRGCAMALVRPRVFLGSASSVEVSSSTAGSSAGAAVSAFLVGAAGVPGLYRGPKRPEMISTITSVPASISTLVPSGSSTFAFDIVFSFGMVQSILFGVGVVVFTKEALLATMQIVSYSIPHLCLCVE